jgi:hypothetical protein
MIQNRHRGLTFVALLMILFGAAEVVTGFTHKFFGIYTAATRAGAYEAAAIGALYTLSGLLVLAMRKWAAALAILLLIADIAGRCALIVTGFYPTDSFRQSFAVAAGTAIVAIFAIYVGSKWKCFR